MSSADTASAHGRSERTVSPSTPTPSDEKLGVSSLGSAAAHPAQDATPAASVDEKLALPTPSSESVAPYRIRTTDFGFLPIRKSLRHDPDVRLPLKVIGRVLKRRTASICIHDLDHRLLRLL
jgi:hypothetical protein